MKRGDVVIIDFDNSDRTGGIREAANDDQERLEMRAEDQVGGNNWSI
jgi:hypothetical protein